MLNHNGMAKDHLGQVLNQPCWKHKPNFNWRRFTSSNKSNKKRQINVRWNKHKNKKQWGKACLCTGGGV